MTRHLKQLRGPMLTSSAMLSALAATECFKVIFVRVDGFLYLASPYGDWFIDDSYVGFDPHVVVIYGDLLMFEKHRGSNKG